jgi:hypothetical protein
MGTTNRPWYSHAGGAMLRAAAFPLHRRPATWPALSDTDSCRSWLEEVWALPGFAEATRYASSSFAALVETERRVRVGHQPGVCGHAHQLGNCWPDVVLGPGHFSDCPGRRLGNVFGDRVQGDLFVHPNPAYCDRHLELQPLGTDEVLLSVSYFDEQSHVNVAWLAMSHLMVFVMTNRFSTARPFYGQSATIRLPYPTNYM